MGFPDFVIPGRTADPQSEEFISNTPAAVQLPQVSTNHLLQCLAQLVDVREFAAEVFTNLHTDAQKTLQRINNVRGRIQNLSAQVPGVETTFRNNSPECFYGVEAKTAINRRSNPKGGLFIRSKAPHAVDRRRHDSNLPPDLNQLNRYEKCLEINKSPLNCLDRYTNPRFFFDEWLAGEQLKFDMKKKRKKKKKKKKKKKTEKLVIEGVKKKYKDEFGQYVKVTGSQAVEADDGYSGVSKRGQGMVINNVQYGQNMDLSDLQGSRNQGTRESVYIPGQSSSSTQKNRQPSQTSGMAAPTFISAQPEETQRQTVQPSYSAPVEGYTAAPVAPPPPVVKSGGPPVAPRPPAMNPTNSNPLPTTRGPPTHHPTPPQPTMNPIPTHPRPPQPVIQQPPSQPMAPPTPSGPPPIPAELNKYAKMLKIRLPHQSIRNKMRQDGIDEALFDFWLDPNGPKGVGTPPSSGSGPPAAPGGGPPRPPGGPPAAPGGGPPQPPGGGRANLMASITGGTQLKSSSAPAPRRAPAAPAAPSFLDQIKQKKTLKSAGARKLAEAPKNENKRDNLMDALRSGVALNSAKRRVIREKTPEPEEGNIFALLQRRQLLSVSDDEDSSSDEEWSS